MTNVSHLTIGLDLGDKNSELCVLDSERAVVRRGSVATTKEAFAALFAEYSGATLVFEVGSQSRWVQSLARESALGKVIMADPRQLKLITQSHKKTDRADAYLQARVGQAMPDLLNGIEHRSEEAHTDLQLLRTREFLVAQRTSTINRIRGIVKTTGQKLPSTTATYFFRMARPYIPEHKRPVCEPLFAMLEGIHEQALCLNRAIRQMLEK